MVRASILIVLLFVGCDSNPIKTRKHNVNKNCRPIIKINLENLLASDFSEIKHAYVKTGTIVSDFKGSSYASIMLVSNKQIDIDEVRNWKWSDKVQMMIRKGLIRREILSDEHCQFKIIFENITGGSQTD